MTVVYPLQMDMFHKAKRNDPTANKKVKYLSYVSKKSQRPHTREYVSRQPDLIDIDEETLRQTIEDMRKQLHELCEQKGFADPAVIQLSQELDSYLVRLQRIMFAQYTADSLANKRHRYKQTDSSRGR